MRGGKKLGAIFASTQSLGIGRNNGLPWGRIREDMTLFRNVTTRTVGEQKRNAVVMGHHTFQSMDSKPLPNRFNVVLTSRAEEMRSLETSDVKFASSLEQAVRVCEELDSVEKIYVIGGGKVYNELFKKSADLQLDDLYWSYVRVGDSLQTDANLDKKALHKLIGRMRSVQLLKQPSQLQTLSNEKKPFVLETYRYSTSEPRQPQQANYFLSQPIERHPEQQYLELLDRLRSAPEVRDRTGVGTKQLFGHMMRFNVGESFPLLTTKKVHFHSIVEELLWFIRGSTFNGELQEKGVKIWNGNSSKEFLAAQGLPYEEGDLGPIYGFQWRHFGAEYSNHRADYSGKGVDQLRWVVEEMRRNPASRRLIVSAWNPLHMDRMALPPCHVLFQFNIEGRKLNMSMYQRSADVGLGVPFNIASYSLLLCLVADFLGLERGEFVYFIGCAHIYLNHVDALEQQLRRTPFPFPDLDIRPRAPKTFLDQYSADEIQLKYYYAHEPLKMKMAV